MKVYALVGSSGTGKSYKALQIAKEKNIEYIIDDGILISKNKKIGGSSAKRESTKMSAVKRAIFHFDDHRESMIKHLEEEDPESILIIGTSNRMVKQISEQLKIDPIYKIFQIEDVSSAKDIELAISTRRKEGKHVIPLPTVEVKKDFSGYFMDRLRVLITRRGFKNELAEKTIIRPTFSYIGKYSISLKAIYQIMSFSLNDVSYVNRFLRGRVVEYADGIHIICDVSLNNEMRLTKAGPKIQLIVKESIENMTGLNVKSIDVNIKNINVL